MNKPSPTTPAAAALVPNARLAVIVTEVATVATSKFSPVRAFLITSPTVKMYADEEPAPVTVMVTGSSVELKAALTRAYRPP